MSDIPEYPKIGSWGWWAGTSDEWYSVGPCRTKGLAIAEMIEDGEAQTTITNAAGGASFAHVFHVVEARIVPLKLADWIELDILLERADEKLADSDLTGCEGDEGPWFVATPAQEKDLQRRIREACDAWQAEHGLNFVTRTFTETRNQAVVNVPIYAKPTGIAVPAPIRSAPDDETDIVL